MHLLSQAEEQNWVYLYLMQKWGKSKVCLMDTTLYLVAGFISNHYVRLFCRTGSYLKTLHVAVVLLIQQQTISKNTKKCNMGEFVLILILFFFLLHLLVVTLGFFQLAMLQ